MGDVGVRPWRVASAGSLATPRAGGRALRSCWGARIPTRLHTAPRSSPTTPLGTGRAMRAEPGEVRGFAG